MGKRIGKSWNTNICGILASLVCLTAGYTEESGETNGDGYGSTLPHRNRMQSSCSRVNYRNMVVVSTLDGYVSALDVKKGGNLEWTVNTGRPLLKSSISKLEINRNGVLLRLIPALDGCLYQFDGKVIEPVPFTADTLLSSSFRLNEDSTVVGGKETETYGVDINSGKMKYICTTEGCQQLGEPVTDDDDILVISRSSKTVRAVELKSGVEKWNFSVGQHSLDFKRSTADPQFITDQSDEEVIHIRSCNPYGDDWIPAPAEDVGNSSHDDDVEIKIEVPSGIVQAVKKLEPNTVVWEHKFGSPIGNAWTLKNGDLSKVNLFDKHNVPALYEDVMAEEGSGNGAGAPPTLSPSLYLGVHQDQLYVQPSQRLHQAMELATHRPSMSQNRMPTVKWQPYIATAPSRTPLMIHTHQQKIGWQNPDEDADNGGGDDEFGLVPHSGEYPYDCGYYLYEDKEYMPIEKLDNKSKSDNVSRSSDIGIEDVTITLWNWWKEVLVISLATSAFVQLCIMHRKYLQRALPSVRSLSQTNTESSEESESNNEKLKETDDSSDYSSRYLADFKQEECLGKGGFGVVFQARNKVDDQCYAIKRIALNNSNRAREKVMREVKALAKLEHQSIVRYYGAWFEKPPPGWQEERDKLLDESQSYTCTPTVTSNPVTPSHVPEGSKRQEVSADTGGIFGGLCNNTPEICESQKLKTAGSFGFIPRRESDVDNDKSDSFSIPQLRSDNNSFEIVFEESESTDSNRVKSVPFKHYSNPDHSDSLDVIFEDSGCGDKSSSSNSNRPKFDLGETTESSKDQQPTSVSSTSCDTVTSVTPARPSKLELNVTVHPRKLLTPVPKQYLYIQMQLCKRNSLKDWLNENTLNRDRVQLLDMFHQIISAVDYVHNSGLIHRDLKPSNIFFALDGSVKVGDFGLVTPLEEQFDEESVFDPTHGSRKHTDQVGTKLYMSPEQMEGKIYGHKVDIFSLGMIFFELYYPFGTQMERVRTLMEAKRQIFPPRFIKELNEQCEFTNKLLSHNADERPSTQEILDHKLIQEFLEGQPNLCRIPRNRSRTISSSSDQSNPNTSSSAL